MIIEEQDLTLILEIIEQNIIKGIKAARKEQLEKDRIIEEKMITVEEITRVAEMTGINS